MKQLLLIVGVIAIALLACGSPTEAPKSDAEKTGSSAPTTPTESDLAAKPIKAATESASQPACGEAAAEPAQCVCPDDYTGDPPCPHAGEGKPCGCENCPKECECKGGDKPCQRNQAAAAAGEEHPCPFMAAAAAGQKHPCPFKAEGKGCPHAGEGKGCPHAGEGKGCPHAGEGKGCPYAAEGKGCPYAGEGKTCPYADCPAECECKGGDKPCKHKPAN